MNAGERQFLGLWLGRRAFPPVHELQQELHEARKNGEIPDVLLFVEHEPVITFGRGAHVEHLLASEDELKNRGIDLAKTGRGGDVTLHAPGQLVAYPIVDLNPDRRDVRRYVRDLTECMRRIVGSAGVAAGSIEEHVGLWVDLDDPGSFSGKREAMSLAKIGAIGVRVSRWVTMHGFALNLSTDLDLYRLIVPCGISEYPVSSVESLGSRAPTVHDAAQLAFSTLADIWDAHALAYENASSASLNEAALLVRGR
jgi:lipoyl(octanoyl) transferase